MRNIELISVTEMRIKSFAKIQDHITAVNIALEPLNKQSSGLGGQQCVGFFLIGGFDSSSYSDNSL